MHGLIFETSVWLLAGSTRFSSWLQCLLTSQFPSFLQWLIAFVVWLQMCCLPSDTPGRFAYKAVSAYEVAYCCFIFTYTRQSGGERHYCSCVSAAAKAKATETQVSSTSHPARLSFSKHVRKQRLENSFPPAGTKPSVYSYTLGTLGSGALPDKCSSICRQC